MFVSRPLWAHFHKRWGEIEREWLGGGTDGWSLDVLTAAMDGMRAARAALLTEIRTIAPHCGGPYLIPV